MNTIPAYTLITGGSHGIGKSMAEACAQKGLNVLLIALDEPQLHETTKSIQEAYGVKTDCLGINLTHPDAIETIMNWLKTNQYQVNRLINNAGFGRNGLFYKIEEAEYLSMIKLNNEVMVRLTYHLLPAMLELSEAAVMNMSSIEANMPNPYKAVYTGTKNFVYAFTLALREELKNTNVSVSVLCPGPTLTNEDGLKRIKAQGKKAQILLMYPKEVAEEAINGMLKGKQVIVPGPRNKLLNRIMYVMPTKTKMNIMERIFRSYREE